MVNNLIPSHKTRNIEVALQLNINCNNPEGIFNVYSTLNWRQNFDGRRKSVEKRKNISTVVEKALKFRQS